MARARRALAEFRIRGVSTNIPFLQAVLADPDFVAGDVSTAFIEQRPELLTTHVPADRGTRLLRWLAEVDGQQAVRRARRPVLDPREKLPRRDRPDRSRRRAARDSGCSSSGPEGFAADLRSRTSTEVTDTTFRDAHQSLLATRVRTKDLLRIAPYVGRMTPELLSVECWGGATYDVALRFLAGGPVGAAGRAALQHARAVPADAAARPQHGRLHAVPDEGHHLVRGRRRPTVGIDIFRIFDALNDVEQMRPAIEAVRETGTTIAEVALCYTARPHLPDETLYTLDYYLRLAEQIVDAGAHVLAIKDMAGLLRPPAAAKLVSALRENGSTCRCTCTPTTRPAASWPRCWPRWTPGWTRSTWRRRRWPATTSQPPASALVAALAHTERATHLDLRAVMDLEPYWEAVRKVYAPFESGLPSADRTGLRPRDPRRPAVQPAAAGDRPGAGGPVRGRSRPCTPRPAGSSAGRPR